MVVIVVIRSAIIGDEPLKQLQLYGNACCNCCNSIGDESATVVEVESSSSSRAITTVADAVKFNGNAFYNSRRQSLMKRRHVT